MRYLCITLLVIMGQVMPAQDEIISRATLAKIPGEHTILNITTDSIHYQSGSAKTIIPLDQVIAYRKGYKYDPPYVFPDPDDQKKYSIKGSKAKEVTPVKEEPKNVNGRSAVWSVDIALIRPYLLGVDFTDDSLSSNNKVMVYKEAAGKSRLIKTRRKMYFTLSSDPYDRGFVIKKYKFTEDSMLYFKYKFKKESHYYGVRLSDINRIGIQTSGTIATKIIIGVAEIPLLLFNPMLITTWFHPIYKDIYFPEWSLKVSREIRKR